MTVEKKTKVNTKRLNRGTITNRGCTAQKNSRNGAKAEDIKGQRFGLLVARKRVENRGDRTMWECQCDCGNTYIAATKELKNGNCKSCGCLLRKKQKGMVNIAGQKYGRLTALYPTEDRDKKGSVYWHCRCTCGNEIDVSEDRLVHGTYRSCGCLRKEMVWDKLPGRLHLVDGTCVEILEKRKKRKDNKSGFRGVRQMKNGKYTVSIGFKGKKFYIATASTLQEAIQERLAAERTIHDRFVQAYYKWKSIVDDKEENKNLPFIYDVERRNGEFVVHTNIEV